MGRKQTEAEKRQRRAERIAANATPESEARGQESEELILFVLGDARLRQMYFPWILGVEKEMDRLGDDEWDRKTDLYVDLDPRLCQYGLYDQIRVQVKSGDTEIAALRKTPYNCKELIHLTFKQWQELQLCLMFGQYDRYEMVAASFVVQLINYVRINAGEAAAVEFESLQTKEMKQALAQFFDQGIFDSEWRELLDWVAGAYQGKKPKDIKK